MPPKKAISKSKKSIMDYIEEQKPINNEQNPLIHIQSLASKEPEIERLLMNIETLNFDEYIGQSAKIYQIKEWIIQYNTYIQQFYEKENKRKKTSEINSIEETESSKKKSPNNKKKEQTSSIPRSRKTLKEKKDNIDYYGPTQKKCLLLVGNSGSGKTLLSNLIIREMQRRPIQYELGERTIKKIFEQTVKYSNVLDYLRSGNPEEEIVPSTIVLLLDDIDTLFLDNTIYSEIQEIMRDNKFTIPIIATCKETDKRIYEFRKFCTEIKLTHPINSEMERWLIEKIQLESVLKDKISIEWIKGIVEYSKCDFRTMEQMIFELKIKIYQNSHYFELNELDELSKREKIDKFLETFQNKIQEYSIFDHFQKIINYNGNKNNNQSSVNYMNLLTQIYDTDYYLLSLMMQQNYLSIIQEKNATFAEKLQMGQTIANSFSKSDHFYSMVFNNSIYSQWFEYMIFYSIIIPIITLKKKKNRMLNPPIYKYPSILSKLSQKISNHRSLQNTFIYDNDNISHYRYISGIINDQSIWEKYYLSNIIYQFLQNGIIDPNKKEDDVNYPNKKNKMIFSNHFMPKYYSSLKKMNILLDDYEQWLKYYKILYWNNCDDKKIFTANKKNFLDSIDTTSPNPH
jgi:hypothetical protein